MSIKLPTHAATFPVVGDRAPPLVTQAQTPDKSSRSPAVDSDFCQSPRAALRHTASSVVTSSSR